MLHILVLTASAGEPQLKANSQSVRCQVGVRADQVVFEGLGYLEAHEAIVSESLKATGKYDWVAKLDGDMVLRDEQSLKRLLTNTRAEDRRVSTPVADAYSGRSIMGFHLYRPESIPPKIHVDPVHSDAWLSAIPSRIKRFGTPLVDHAPCPDTAQAVRYGLQRGLKASVEGPLSNHWWVMQGTASLARRRDSPIARFALASFLVGLGTLQTAVGEPTAGWLNRSSPSFDRLVADLARVVNGDDNPRVAGQRFWRSHIETYGNALWTAIAATRCEVITARGWARQGRLPA